MLFHYAQAFACLIVLVFFISSIDVLSQALLLSPLSFPLCVFFHSLIALFLSGLLGPSLDDSDIWRQCPPSFWFCLDYPSSSCSPSLFCWLFCLFKVNQYLEHCSPSFMNHAWLMSLPFELFSLFYQGVFKEISSSLAFSLFACHIFDDTLLIWFMSLFRLYFFICFLFFSSAVATAILFISF